MLDVIGLEPDVLQNAGLENEDGIARISQNICRIEVDRRV